MSDQKSNVKASLLPMTGGPSPPAASADRSLDDQSLDFKSSRLLRSLLNAVDEKYVGASASQGKYDSSSTRSNVDEKSPGVTAAPALMRASKSTIGQKMGKTLKPIKVTLVGEIEIPSVVTTGVVNGSFNVSAANVNYNSEFTDFGNVYEEYRILGGKFVFGYNCSAAFASAAQSTLHAMSYTTTTSGNASAVVQLCDDRQHKLFNPPNLNGGAAGSIVKGPSVFSFKVPKDILIDYGGTLSVDGGWTDTSNTSQVYGRIRQYMISASPTVITNAVNGILYLEVEFRNRL